MKSGWNLREIAQSNGIQRNSQKLRVGAQCALDLTLACRVRSGAGNPQLNKSFLAKLMPKPLERGAFLF
jgi:hypothetical protein